MTVFRVGGIDRRLSMLLLFVRSMRFALGMLAKNGISFVVRFVMWSSARLSSISPMLKSATLVDFAAAFRICLSIVS